ncbi:DNA methyltransferase [Emticicia sp.]|uniref:DNA methyltransferase n=1 Tax=Emticicia sp. TaxID=1930953 RepID=UPI0037527BC0
MQNLQNFVDYCHKHIKGDEKGEAQIFLDHFFMALDYAEGLKDAGAECEFRLKNEKNRSTSFGDLVWKKRVLIEMKKRGENLEIHLQQAQSYWLMLAGDRPRYVILCNFDEFWIYDYEISIYKPAEIVKLTNLVERKDAFGFLLPRATKPVFGKNLQDVTGKAAEKIAEIFRSMVKRGVSREDALRFCMQCIIAMFAEDVELLPNTIFTRLVQEALENNTAVHGNDKIPISYDLIGGLFKEMNTKGVSEGMRYNGVEYFNGGLFETVKPIELTLQELNMLDAASMQNWKNVNPAIFGSIFEAALETTERHKLGAHYTHEIDIKKIIDPCIVQPWNERIDAAQSMTEYFQLLTQLAVYQVLDPACGSGNFLFVAFKEMKLLEKKLLTLLRETIVSREDSKQLTAFLLNYSYVNTKQLHGYDLKPFAVELAKVTLMVAKELAWLDHREAYDNKFSPLPLDNLDENIICCDALLDGNQARKWIEADVIIGNPPYQSKNKMQAEFGVEYMNKLRNAYAEVPGRADFCVYWFYKGHKTLKNNGRAGLVATNTIRQNYSREGSLDYIVKNGGTIFNAVNSQDWSGEAAVFVSIVNWIKGEYEGDKFLFSYNEKNVLFATKQATINSSLSLEVDVAAAKVLECNRHPKCVFQGQSHGHEGFLLPVNEAKKILTQNPDYKEVMKPFLIADELIGNLNSQPKRFVIDFSGKDLIQSASLKTPFKIVEKNVLPDRKEKGEKQQAENDEAIKINPQATVNKHHINFYNNWWHLSYSREDLLEKIKPLKRYISCARISKRNIFEFVSTEIRPNDALMVFSFDDYYSFGIIHSVIHFEWWKAKCSTLEDRLRYTANTIWDTFSFPQNPYSQSVIRVTEVAKQLHQERTKMLQDYKMSLRDLYRTLEKPGRNRLRELHEILDTAVGECYGFEKGGDILTQLLALNLQVSEAENPTPPGLPACVQDASLWAANRFITDDCVKFL